MGTGKLNAWGSPGMNYSVASNPGGAEILLVTSWYRNHDKLWPDGPLGLYANFTYIVVHLFTKKASYSLCLCDFQVKGNDDVVIKADNCATDEKKSKSNEENGKNTEEQAKTPGQAKPSNAASTSLCNLF